jgi:phosphatidylserine synthase
MKQHARILSERNLADWVTLLIAAPFLLSLYFIMKNEPELALLMGLVAFALDSLDGVIARKLAVASDFGRQLVLP